MELGRPGLGLEFKRADAEEFAQRSLASGAGVLPTAVAGCKKNGTINLTLSCDIPIMRLLKIIGAKKTHAGEGCA
jgi:hypothetical protein